jgi:urease accessory protein
MYDAAYPSDAVSGLQRATGALELRFRRRGARSALSDLRQSGCLKARFPHGVDADWADAVMLNIGGGVAAGDRLDIAVALEPGARLTLAAQAAERFYRALPGAAPSVVRAGLTVAAGAAMEWLPQETILFDRACVDRRLDVSLAADARFLGVESLVFGRKAMGETVRTARLRDLIRIRRDGRLLLHDAIRLDGEVASVLAHRATGNGARAVATLVLVDPGAEALCDPLRAALTGLPVEAGVSAWDGLLLSRIVAAEGACLRAAVVAGLALLRGGRALPRVWMC